MDMEELRAKRMQELQQLQQHKQGSNAEEQQQQQRQQEMMNSMLSQILNQDARARLNSIALVKPEKAKRVTGILIQMARTGKIAEKMTDQQLLALLEEVTTHQPKTKVKFERRRVMDSDSDTD